MAKAKKQENAALITNKTARRDYDIRKTYIAGIVLSGAETKSLRTGHGHLKGAFVNIKDQELWLFNATINATNANRTALPEETQTKARKLLVNSKQLAELATAKEQGLTIIPLKVLTKTRYIKVEIATAKGLRKYDKRQKIKTRDTKLDTARAIKSYNS
ncbi:SsrA-binding protein SmpB [Candidatus Saccharibacteria bacterium]|nr:SsrA-binding protein SmpB [Candidatus Saccharibacteria bacterium]MBP7834816.1 SsrA-binding protein SmpB [Candidatus Saccharibacteria bacterium]